ncbi:hypothetical protein EDF67_10682 [Sphingobacterium sp. JUb78]|jgi:hypothetical protein|nr:hypothetical protein [Sphingobacterium kitahiroshimense]TCR08926.1 hypothetical protein EDF67_10682 [Sphingobacterium sp. JUb78]
MQVICRSLELSKKRPINGNDSVIKYQTNGNGLAINKRTKTIAKRSSRINSDFFLTNLTPTSKFLRLSFESASVFHRLQCMKSRSTVEQKSSGSIKRGEEKEKKVSRSLLDVAKQQINALSGRYTLYTCF